jgi:hypothetical protein
MELSGSATFCDDIRQEVGGKISLMGCYGNDMRFHGVAFPILIPKLCVHIVAKLPGDRPIPPLKLFIYFPGDPLDAPSLNQDFPVPEEMKSIETLPKVSLNGLDTPADRGPPIALLLQNIVISPAIIKQAGYILARLMYGDIRVRLGVIKVMSVSPVEERSKTN